jgi:carbamate kinase
VHFVQIKTPLLTAGRVEEAHSRGQTVATEDTYKSMGYARGASALGVDLLVITTGVPRVALDFGTPRQRFIDAMGVAELERHLADGQFPPGSMGPKIEAAVQFLRAGGREVLITSPEQLGAALAGRTGTRLMSDKEAPSMKTSVVA